MCLWSLAVAQLAGEAPPPLTWPAERTTRISGGTPDDAAPTGRATAARAAFDEALRQALGAGQLTVAELGAATGWPKTTLAGRLASALDRGVVVRARFGVYAAG